MSSASLFRPQISGSSSRTWSRRPKIKQNAVDGHHIEFVQVCSERSTAPGACWPLVHEELIHSLTGFVFSGWVTCQPPHQHKAGEGAGSGADNPSMWQVVLGYFVTSSRD